MAVLTALLLLQTALVEEPDFRNVTPTEMTAALQACGLLHVSVFYDETTQSETVVIEDNQASDEALECAFWAQDRTAYFLYWGEELGPRYGAIAERAMRPRAIARAQAYFARRGDLGPLPVKQAGQSEIDFARAIERFCGPDAHGFFSGEFGAPTVSHEWILARRPDQMGAVLGCITNAALLTDLEWGIIGNERVSAELAD